MHVSTSVHASEEITQIDRRMFGSFIEHLGRVVYTGLYEPGHPTADEDGMREDVLDLTRQIGVSLVRYPGGNFVSTLRWEDSVGPKHERPTRADPAWQVRETNEFGLNEFMRWAAKANVEPMMVVNLGTRGIEAAKNLLEYCNFPGGTFFSDLRRQHGVAEPHGIKLWGLGNEMDGPWQIGHKTAEEYSRLARETARGMRRIDPSIELVVAGSSGRAMPTFPSWDATVLEHCYEDVDYLALHSYQMRDDPGIEEYLAVSVDLESFLLEAIATCDYAQAKKRSRKRMLIAVDEYNVSYQASPHGEPIPWTSPQVFAEYEQDTLDAFVLGTMLITFLRHADRVRLTCQALLVNAMGVIRTEAGGGAWRQASSFPLAHVARWGQGHVLRTVNTSPKYDGLKHGDIPYLDAVATYDGESEMLTVFAANRHPSTSVRWSVHLLDAVVSGDGIHTTLSGSIDVPANNTARKPLRVRPEERAVRSASGRGLDVTLQPLSWNVLRLPMRRTATPP